MNALANIGNNGQQMEEENSNDLKMNAISVITKFEQTLKQNKDHL